MKKLIVLIAVCLFAGIPAAAQQDKHARKLADKMAIAFSNGPGWARLDRTVPVSGKLRVSLHHWITDGDDPEFTAKTFKNFAAMSRWLKKDENEPGFPMRTSGEKVSCRSGLCRLDLIDGQMMHNHVYLTRVWYGYQKGKIYVRRIRILYG